MSFSLSKPAEHLSNLIWLIALLGLPLTSFPLFIQGLGAIVAPFSALPVFILLFIWLLPYLLQKKPFPKESIPLLIFLLAALVALAAAFFLDIPSFKDKSIAGQEARSLVTLAIGLAFFTLFSTYPADRVRLHRTLQWIDIGGIVLIAWSAVQSYYILFQNSVYPSWFLSLQDYLAIKTPSYTIGLNRISGLAYEPSWFTHQLVVLYLPLWISATIQRSSSFSLRLFKLSVENILLVIGLFEFFLGSPRVSFLSLFLIMVFLFIKFNLFTLRKVEKYIQAWRGNSRSGSQPPKTLIAVLIGLSFCLVYIAITAGVMLAAGQRDPRIGNLLSAPPKLAEITRAVTLDEPTIIEWGRKFAFMERVVYWFSGLHVFNDHPLLGVGLGNSGFFFLQTVPSTGWQSFEIRDLIYRATSLPNTKSLWVRILAETGLVGFAIFLTWLIILWASARFSFNSEDPSVRLVALAGQMALLAMLAEGFSIDSFAMPYFWVATGLVAACGMLARRETYKPLPD